MKFDKSDEGIGAARGDGLIEIDPQGFKDWHYIGMDGKPHPYTLTRVLLHELIHLADPAYLSLVSAGEKAFREVFGDIPKGFAKMIRKPREALDRFEQFKWAIDRAGRKVLEPYTIDKTNQLMFRHYGELFRDKEYYGLPIKIGFWEKKLLMGDDIFTPGREGTNHEAGFSPLPILDIADLQNDRSDLVAEIFLESFADREWEKHAKQEEEIEKARFDQKEREIKAAQKSELDEAKIQHRKNRHQRWQERNKNRNSPER
jgi:hypothetical protein